MAKPFSIRLEVEEIALGKVLAVLNKTPGVIRFDLDFDATAKSKTNGTGRTRTGGKVPRYSVPGNVVAARLILAQAGKKFHSKNLIPAFVSDSGRAPNSVTPILSRFKQQGFLRVPQPGVYEATAKGRDFFRSMIKTHADQTAATQKAEN